MDYQQEKPKTNEQEDFADTMDIEDALQQMEILYKSRCVQAPLGANVIIREIKED